MNRCALGILVLLALFPRPAWTDDDDFREHVAPILQRRCLSCHNDADPKGDLSLQTAKTAMADGYIDPGKPDDSHLLELITPVNGRAKMPKDGDPLTADEVAAIRKWIRSGASWPPGLKLKAAAVSNFDWWSYRPIQRPAVPQLDDAWIRNAIDAFILETQQQKGLTHAPEADRATLIRRITYDLTGLPPTPQEVRAFVEDTRPQAYERLVDRLLASKAYGERWARHWLDVVKYADTCGYDKDKLRPHAWPYRDYVIRSFNQDKAYSRFLQEQLAGDVLFPGEPDGILGLGFIAAGPWDFIGHVEVPESKIDGKVARNLDRDDMVSNTLNTFCSVTIQCARCHNHKFDPITQEDYYGLQSIFAAVDRADRAYDLDPAVDRERRSLNAKLADLNSKLATLQQEMEMAGGAELKALDDQIARLKAAQQVKKASEFGYHSALAKIPDQEKWVTVDLGSVATVAQIVLRPCHDDFGGIGAGFGFPLRFKVDISSDNQTWQTIHDRTQQTVANPGLTAYEISNLNTSARWIRITANQLAPRRGVYILALAELQVLDAAGNNLANGAKVTALDSIEARPRWSKNNLTDNRWAVAGDPRAAANLRELVKKRATIVKTIETPLRVAKRYDWQKDVEAIKKQLADLPAGRMVYAAATSFKAQSNFKPTEGKLRTIHVLARGDVQQPQQLARPAMLRLDSHSDSLIHADAEGQRRAALAHWLVDQNNPLVWRSIVNRIWQYHFGQGMVATPNDFGRMGARPTHPRLLDWLATEFRDGGQSMKRFHRLIVTSSTYRQSSRFVEANAMIDQDNQFLWRMNRRRLSAEEIRDSILAASGALDRSTGGPGYYLFALEKTAHSPHYEYHKFDPSDPASHRRSVYRFIVRSQPNPWMTTLDCADSSQSTPRRTETLTSLQALSLLNNQFNLVMAERFAARLEAQADTVHDQVGLGIALVTQREPQADEQRALVAYAETHGLANLCRILFNLSEFVYLD